MAIFGFICLVIIAVYCMIWGFLTNRLSYRFSGKMFLWGVMVMILGFILLILAFKFAPFTIVIT